MKFNYSAKTRDGKTTKKGEIDAPNQEVALQSLRKRDLIVYSLVPANEKKAKLTLLGFKKISTTDKVKFTQQLSDMITAGLTLTKSLEIISSQTENKAMEEMASKILNDVESGMTLSSSLEKFPEVFNANYISLVRAGEASGKLDAVLKRLAESLEKQRKFVSKVKGALIYPIIIFVAMGVVFSLIIILVIPKMATLYDSLSIQLPLSTRVLIGLSDFLVSYWWLVIIIIAGMAYGFKLFKKTLTGQYFLAKLTFKLPIFGNLLKQSGLVEFTRTLGLLIESGVPIVDGLEIVKNVTNNIIYRDAIGRFVEEVKHGAPLSQAIAKEETFPAFVAEMMIVGEETGTVDEKLNNLSIYYEGEVDNIVKNLSTAMEPIIMIMLGVMVALLIISVITPIYQLTSQF